MSTEEISAKSSPKLVSLTEQITQKQEEIKELVESFEYEKARTSVRELTELLESAEKIKKEIQTEAITAADVDALRDIKPARKSVQNMLENEVARTPKFEKLLSDEMGVKSAYEMRKSDNEWRNDESKYAVVVEVSKRKLPARLTEIRKRGRKDIPRGAFVNRDTGIEIIFGMRSIEETIAKAIQDNKRGIPVEARISALYQMRDLSENAICFDSQISEYNLSDSKNKTPNTLFMHQLYGLIKYRNEGYLVKLFVEESYITDKQNKFNGTSNRIYNFKDIKITSVEANRIFSPAVDINNNGKDTSTDVIKISIPQLYNIIKNYDQNFFESPLAAGRIEREAEIKAQEEFSAVMDKLKSRSRSEWEEKIKNRGNARAGDGRESSVRAEAQERTPDAPYKRYRDKE